MNKGHTDKIRQLTTRLKQRIELVQSRLVKKQQKAEQLSAEIAAILAVVGAHSSEQLGNNLREKRRQLRSLEQEIEVAMQNDTQLQVYRVQMTQLEHEGDILLQQLSSLSSRQREDEVRFNKVRQQQYEASIDLRRLRYQIAWVREDVLINTVEVYAEDRLIFIGDSHIDENFLKRLDEEQLQARQFIEEAEAENKDLENSFPGAHQDYLTYQQEWASAAKDVQLASNTVADLIWKNAGWKSLHETLAYFADIGIAAAEGGKPAVAMELVQKSAESIYAIANDQVAFESFDESKLRTLYKEQFELLEKQASRQAVQQASTQIQANDPYFALSTDSGLALDSVNFLESQGSKAPFLTTKEVGLYGIEKMTAQGDFNRLQIDQNTQTSLQIIGNESKENRAKYRKLAREQADTKEIRRLSSGVSDRTNEIFNTMLERNASQQRMLATQYEVQLREQTALQNIPKQSQKSSAKVMKNLDKLKAGNKITSLAKGLTTGLATELAKAGMNAYRNQEERTAWVEFFEKEMYYKVIHRLTKEASGKYWALVDRIDINRQYIVAQKSLNAELAEIRDAYNDSFAAQGFFVKQSEAFSPEKAQDLKLVLKARGMHSPRDVHLAATAIDDSSFIKGVLTGAGHLGGQTYIFNLSTLSIIEPQPGPIPLLIQQK